MTQHGPSCACVVNSVITQERKERKFGWDLLCPVPLVRLEGQDSYITDWSMKDGLLRLVREIRELHVPKELVGVVCPTLSLRP